MLYFAYGSNMNLAQMRRRCPAAKFVGTASLANHALCFAGHSFTRAGAVASVAPRIGWVTQGVVYELTGGDLFALDRFEGHPFVYERVTRVVALDGRDGRRVRAQVYVHRSKHRSDPHPEYLLQIRRAYRRRGFDMQALTLAVWGMT